MPSAEILAQKWIAIPAEYNGRLIAAIQNSARVSVCGFWRILALPCSLLWRYGCTILFMANVFNFEAWKSQLRENCAKEGKLSAFTTLEDFVLLLLFERGVEPTPKAIVDDANDVKVA
jgi:hypothetical protein